MNNFKSGHTYPTKALTKEHVMAMRYLDAKCRGSFVSAVFCGLQEFRRIRIKHETSARTAVFKLANSFWGSFVEIADPEVKASSRRDNCLSAELKELGTDMLRAISRADSWRSLAINISTTIETWSTKFPDNKVKAREIADLELRKHALHFSEIIFNACYSRGNPLDVPLSFEAAVLQMSREFWSWHDSL